VTAARVRSLRSRVLEWGSTHRRDLPWRRTRDPWAVLVSEVMLQQTQAERVVPYHRAFVRAFATPSACAEAGPAEVVRMWSGLGYNRRALNLHRAAQMVVSEYGGRVPDDEAALRGLPGVGPYTARAVLSFAFERDVAPVDTNVARVLSRCVAGEGLSAGAAQALADRLVPAGDSWAFNQTMFDLGATVCTPRPSCDECPLRRQCRWHGAGRADPDPWRSSPSARRQTAFAGSDRQGRGRLLEALRGGPLRRSELAVSCGWPDDGVRAERIGQALVAEGFAEWSTGPGSRPTLRLR
jgi:A/G-specific adenine glycosylase